MSDTNPVGTVAYMSPEQALGERADSQTDIFSLGAILFEMLTGRPPFAATAASGLPLQIVQAAAPAPSAVNRSLPNELDPIVAKMLAKSLDRRYEAAATLAAELRSVAAILDVRSDASDVPPIGASAPRRRSAAWIVAALILAAIAALLWFATRVQ